MFEMREAVVGQLGELVVVEIQVRQRRQSTDGAWNMRQRTVDDAQRRQMTARQITGQQCVQLL